MTAPARAAASPATEAVLVADVVRLTRRQWPVRAVGREVRSHGRCRTDACFLIRDEAAAVPLLLGVEAKLSDGARAVAQAAMNRYAVDLSCVAMPAGRISDAVLEQAQRHGVGVLAVSKNRLEVAVPAVRNAPDPVLRERVLLQLASVRPRGTDRAGFLVAGGPAAGGDARGAA